MSHRIRSLSIVGGFLDGASFDLGDGLNCLIGARGAGKTTVIEFVRYALDELPNRESDPQARRRIESLVERNLGNGRIQLVVETKDGLSYIVNRSPGENPMVLSPDGKPTGITLRAGSLFQVDIYSQNEIEGLAERAEAQLALIDNFHSEQIRVVATETQRLIFQMRANANQIIPLEEKLATLAEDIHTLPNVEDKLKAFIGTAKEASHPIDEAHAHKALRDREQAAIRCTKELLGDLAPSLQSMCGQIDEQVNSDLDRDILAGPNGATFSELKRTLARCAGEVDRLLELACEHIRRASEDLAAVSTALAHRHDQQELAFRKLIEKHKIAQGQANERARLEKLRGDLLVKQRLRNELQQKLDQLREERIDLMRRLSEMRDQRFALRQEVVGRINQQLSPSIRVSIEQDGERTTYRKMIEEALKGARMRQGRVADKIAEAFAPGDLSEVVKSGNSRALVDKAELTPDQADKVITAFADSPNLLELETLEMLDLPRIELKDGVAYKELASLSTGQRCTAILPILLLDSEKPLLVDQPEDNLDNSFIYETIVRSIRKIKKQRQLLFVTHNPNIPVLGEAERVFVLTSTGNSGRKSREGSVDGCRNEIVQLLEGGEEAFKLRQRRYRY